MYKHPLLQKLNLLQKIILISSILIAICFWSNLTLDINPFGTKWAYPFFILYLSIILTDKKKYWKSYKWEFSTIVIWTIFTVFLSFIPAYIDWGQSIFTSIAASIKWTWVLLLYFVNPAKRKATPIKNEKRFSEQKRKAMKIIKAILEIVSPLLLH